MVAGDFPKAVPAKSRPLVEYLQEKIYSGQLANGEKIPPLRTLAAMFDMSYGTAKRGTDYLAGIGLLDKRTSKGLYVKSCNQMSAKKTLSISVFMPESMEILGHGIYATVFSGIQEEALKNEISLSLHYLKHSQMTGERFCKLVGADSGIICLTEMDGCLSDLRFEVPCVAVCTHTSFSGRISTLDMDPMQASELACHEFRRLGIKKITIITDEKAPYLHRAKTFENMFCENGSDCMISIMPSKDELNYSKKEGYLFTTGSVGQVYSEFYRRDTGRYLSEDYAVLSMDGKNLIDAEFHPMNCVSVPWKIVGQMAFEDIIRRVRYPGSMPCRTYVPGELVTQ